MPAVLAFTFDIGGSFQEAVDDILGYIPNIIGFLLILVVGYIITRLISRAIAALLVKIGFDRALHRNEAGQYVERFSPGGRPSALVGLIVFWAIFVFVLSSAIGALKIPALTSFLHDVLHFLPNALAAAAIILIAAAIAGAIGAIVQRTMGDTPTGKVVRAVVPALIMAIAVFMALVQIHIALQIVILTYAALMLALSLSAGLAFGLGGRDVAARLVEGAYAAGDRQREQVRADMQAGRERARADIERTRATVRQRASEK